MDAWTPQFFVFNPERLAAALSPVRLDFHAELPSTNDRALELAVDPGAPTPLVVLAERQTAGRGRGANRWWSPSGGLTFSLLADLPAGISHAVRAGHGLTDGLDSPSYGLGGPPVETASRCRPQVALGAGLAVCETLGELLSGHELRLKWPNDVYLDGRKMCGILVETGPPPARRLIVGIGINVNNSQASAPPDVQARSVSLFDATQREHDPADLLLRLVPRLLREVQSSAGETDWPRRWRTHCLLQGRIVHLESGPRRVVGLCRGLDPDGALLLETETGPQRFLSGSVTRFE